MFLIKWPVSVSGKSLQQEQILLHKEPDNQCSRLLCGSNSQSKARGINAGSKQPEATNVWELLRHQNTIHQEFKAAYALKKHTLKEYQDTRDTHKCTFNTRHTHTPSQLLHIYYNPALLWLLCFLQLLLYKLFLVSF